jgi:hypothetical protein
MSALQELIRLIAAPHGRYSSRDEGLSQQLFAVEGRRTGIDWEAHLRNRRFTSVSEAC